MTFGAVSPENWQDFEQLFESKGGSHHCWCMVWRKKRIQQGLTDKAAKKATLKSYVGAQTPIGILAYNDGQPIAWCSVAPKTSHRKLSNYTSAAHTWSITCFFIQRPYRDQGVSKQLLQAAIQYAKESGAAALEAYPVAQDSPSYRFMGFVPQFEKTGFKHIQPAGKRRHLMLLEL